MPKKDGKPTAAERRDAERIAGNERYIANADDAELARLSDDPTLDVLHLGMVHAEQERRRS